MWCTSEGFLVPQTLSLRNTADALAAETVLRTKTPQFDASGFVCEQHFVESDDGTQIPYFVVRHRDAVPGVSGGACLLNAYVGEVLMLVLLRLRLRLRLLLPHRP